MAVTKQTTKRKQPAMRARNAEATRQKILDAACIAFASKGIEARIEDIAEEASTNRRMIYYYFGSKEGLYLTALEETYLALVKAESEIDIDRLSPLEALTALVETKFDYYVTHPEYVQFVKMENIYEARHLRESDRLDELKAPMAKMLAKVIKRGQKQGSIRAGVEPLDLYLTICALGYFIFSNRHTLSAIFGFDPTSSAALKKRKRVILDLVMGYVRP